jgi:muconolactone delta-isomerase
VKALARWDGGRKEEGKMQYLVTQ